MPRRWGASNQRVSSSKFVWMVRQALKSRPNRLGIYAAATYLFIAALVYVLTAYTGKADSSGLEWLPFFMLAMPWPRIDARLLLPGMIINAGILYLLGTLLGKFRRSNV
jgi:hypothetical protein